MVDWRRLLFSTAVGLVVSVLLVGLVQPAAIGVFAGLLAAAFAARVDGPSDGALVCAAAALPLGAYFGWQAGLEYPLQPGQPQAVILVAAPLLGAMAYAIVGSLTGVVIGFVLRAAGVGRK
jgi:hypothetical protein